VLATVTSALPPGRFGMLDVEDSGRVHRFNEKPPGSEGTINAGFFVLSPRVFDLIGSDDTPWEGVPMQTLVARGQLAAWRHQGFWQPMDTLRDKNYLEDVWQQGHAPWKKW